MLEEIRRIQYKSDPSIRPSVPRKALKCMNDVFTRIGEFQEVDEYEEEEQEEVRCTKLMNDNDK